MAQEPTTDADRPPIFTPRHEPGDDVRPTDYLPDITEIHPNLGVSVVYEGGVALVDGEERLIAELGDDHIRALHAFLGVAVDCIENTID